MAKRNLQEVYADNASIALKDCAKAGYEAIFMPELIERRIEAKADSSFWQKWYTTRSTIETGKTSAGSKIVLISHVPSYLSEAENINAAFTAGLRNGAVIVPNDNFRSRVKLAEQGENGLFIIPYKTLRASPSGLIPISSALKHPLVLPYLGVSKAKAKEYLEKHLHIHHSDIGIWHGDDFVNGETRGRVLFLGENCNNHDAEIDFVSLDHGARFLGAGRASGSKQEVPIGADAQKSVQAEIIPAYTPQEITAALNQLKLSGLEAQILIELKKRKK